MGRADWDTVWFNVVVDIASRSSCMRRQIGAVIVTHENRIVATGYNGPPAGYPLGCATDCPRNLYGDAQGSYRNCISIHAEANALMFCDRREREDGTIYVNEAPCYDCAKLIANSGLAEVRIYSLDNQEHRDVDASLKMLRRSGLNVSVHARS